MASKSDDLPPTADLDREAKLIEFVNDKARAREEIELEEGWKWMKDAGIDVLISILDYGLDRQNGKPFGNRSYAMLYTVSYNMACQTSSLASVLYQRHGSSISDYLRETVVPALKLKRGDVLLAEFVRRWANHKVMTEWMRKFFMHLDKSHIGNKNLPTLTSAALRKFYEAAFEPVKAHVVDNLLAQITKEREGEVIDRPLLRTAIEVFDVMGIASSCTTISSIKKLPTEQQLDIYRREFEARLLSSTAAFYSACTAHWVDAESTPLYLQRAEQVLAEELGRVHGYLHPSSEAPLMQVVVQTVLAEHEAQLLAANTGIRDMLANDKLSDLARLFSLFQRVPDGLLPIAREVSTYITEVGMGVVAQREARLKSLEEQEKQENPLKEPEFVLELIQIYDKYNTMVANQFQSHPEFQKALKGAFETFVNEDRGKHPNSELMAAFCDYMLKDHLKLDQDALEDTIGKLVAVFGFMHEKDMFLDAYRQHMAKRLLNGRETGDENERFLIGKLKIRCGAQFTSKLEGMVNDLAIGEDANRAFRAEWGETKGDVSTVDFDTQVLTKGFWPTQTMVQVHLPAEMDQCIQTFAEYYNKDTSNRVLNWVYMLGEATLRFIPKPGKKYDLRMTTLQALTVMAFNSVPVGTQLSLDAVKEIVGAELKILKRVLHSLACAKYKILAKTPSSRKIRDDDVFAVNSSFKSKRRMLHLVAPLFERTSGKVVKENRKFAIDAGIVRIMKARKRLPHNILIQEVVQQLLLFQPSGRDIKRRIEALIDREYLERDEDDSRILKYMP